MPEGTLRLIRAVPGAASLGPIVARFCREGEGVVTALSDALLPALRGHVDDEDDMEIVPFGALVARTLAECGEDARLLANAAHQTAAVAQAVRTLPDGSPFRRTARFAGLHRAMVDTLHELHAWGLDATDLSGLADRAEPRLGAKLASLAHVDQEAHAVLAALGRETHADHLRASLDAVLEDDGTERRLLVFAGSEVHPLRLRWLRWAASQGFEVTVVVDRHATDGEIFRGARMVEEGLDAPERQDVGDGHRLLRRLFAQEGDGGPAIEVAIASAADPLAEAEWALRGCLDAGPEGAGIYVRDLPGYAPLLESAAKRLGVPLRMVRRAPLGTNAFARLVLSLVDFCASPDVRTLAPVLQSSYLGLTGEGRRRVADALRDAHRRRLLQWEGLEEWSAENAEAQPWLMDVLEWRRAAVGANEPLSDWCRRLTALMTLLRDRMEHPAVGYDSNRDSRARNALESAVCAHASVEQFALPESLDLRRFAARLREIAEASDVSIPPSEHPHAVTVAGDASALGGVGTLFVLGMLEGVFPRRRKEDPILTDEERRALSGMLPDGPPLPTSEDVAAAERDEFYRVCAAARKRVVFSYPLADDTRDNIPAFYLEVVRAAAEDVETVDYPRPRLAPEIETCLAEADRRLREALEGPRELPSPVEIASERARAALIAPEGPTSPNELRDALRCPFMVVARHRLRLRPRRRSARWSHLRKLPQVAGLAAKPDRAEAERALAIALEGELDRLYPELPDWEMQLLRAGGRRLIRDWVRREFAARKAWPKEEDSVRLNVQFGDDGLRDVMPGGIATLEGQIPAMSRIGETNVLHLYGSSAKDSAELTDAEKLYFGLYFLASHTPGRESAIEIEGMGGKRSLLLLTRAGTRPLPSQVQEGLQVVDLGQTEDPNLSKKLFYEDVRRFLKTAVARLKEGEIRAIKGDHCDWCDFGELCRRSKAFGEEDSPFGLDSPFGEG